MGSRTPADDVQPETLAFRAENDRRESWQIRGKSSLKTVLKPARKQSEISA
jgi:hypothetical protein